MTLAVAAEPARARTWAHRCRSSAVTPEHHMWRTPKGDRTLKGAEATLIRALIAQVVDDLDAEVRGDVDRWDFGVVLFDELESPQKFALLAAVGTSLLREDAAPLPLNAVNEATVAALYRALTQAIQVEIEMELGSEFQSWWRSMVLAAVREIDGDDDELPSCTSPDQEDWDVLTETLASFVLWDEDWDMTELVMDRDPEEGRSIKGQLDIADDYFTAVAPDPTDTELAHARQVLLDLTASA